MADREKQRLDAVCVALAVEALFGVWLMPFAASPRRTIGAPPPERP